MGGDGCKRSVCVCVSGFGFVGGCICLYARVCVCVTIISYTFLTRFVAFRCFMTCKKVKDVKSASLIRCAVVSNAGAGGLVPLSQVCHDC